MVKAFISYSWESDSHKQWVLDFAARLRSDGVEVTLDQWHLALGDQLPDFMEKSIRENDYILIICTPKYKEKSDQRTGGVGYEGDIMTSEVFSLRNQRKFIPVLRQGQWLEAAPTWILGKLHVDLRENEYSEDNYTNLLVTLHNLKTDPPPVGKVPVERLTKRGENPSIQSQETEQDIRIMGILTDEVTVPRMDGTRGSALYAIPFKLSRRPSQFWSQAFIETWNRPPSFTSMHRPGIARISGDRIVLNGTTIEEVERYHRDTLKISVQRANELEKQVIEQQRISKQRELERINKHNDNVQDIAKRITFD